MGNSKVIFGDETLIDLTGDTVTPDTMLAGTTAHNRSGEQIVGTATVPEELDDLTDVDLTSPAEGDLLQYNSTSGKWENSDEIPQELAATQEAGAVNLFKHTRTISQTVNGITITFNDDKTVTLNGTATAETDIAMVSAGGHDYWLDAPAGKYIFNGCPTGGSASTYFMQVSWRDANNVLTGPFTDAGNGCTVDFPGEGYLGALIHIVNGAVFNNVVFKPMLYDARLVNPTYQPFTMTNRELTDGVTKATYFNETYTSTSPAGTLNVKGHYFVVGKMCLLFLSYTASVDLSGVTAMSIPNVQLPAPINPNNQSNDIVISVPRDWSGNISMMAIRHSPAGKIQFYYIPKGANTITVVYETV